MTCTEKCWEATECPDHGHSMTPFGRSAPVEMFQCCDNRFNPQINPRHLWDKHDSTRWYTDPDGWNAHASECDRDDCEREKDND
jgi:hypothetical protein